MKLNWSTLLLGVAAGAAGALLVKKGLTDSGYITAERALRLVKDSFKEEGPIDGSWIHMVPEKYEKTGLSKMVYKGGISRSQASGLEQYEFIADARTGTIMDVYRIS
ncbi:MAG TPA: hypothetical protein VEY51_07490 [Chondromyces sp.]|nr:hypothetical protein [Chondromyces sp.]